MGFFDVVVDNKSENTDTLYTYRADMDLDVGDRVDIPFARRRKPAEGYVFDVLNTTDFPKDRIKEVISCDKSRSLNAEMVDTAKWMKARYGVKYIDAIKLFTVGGKVARERGNFNIKRELDRYYELTEEQAKAVSEIRASINGGSHNVFLLKGVSNSGKTEVYMKAAEFAIRSGKSAIIMVPEITLFYQVENVLKRRFGDNEVATMRSGMGVSKMLAEWLRIRRGEAKIVVGTRMAVFAPCEAIGLIVMDEEHETTYKSDRNPKYETLDIAYRRAGFYGGTVVLGSATPSVVSYYRAKNGIYKLIEMNETIGKPKLPKVSIVDMKEEIRMGNRGSLSRDLRVELCRVLNEGRQAILFLNRRGFSPEISCLDCGYRFTCSDCGITMTYHRTQNAMICHYCGKKYPVPYICPECGSKYLKYAGVGTEKVERELNEIFPDASICRLDLDTAKTGRETRRSLRAFQNGDIDILIGTQILAKGLDFKNVGLAGIVMADVNLNIPDYRSAERTYQLISQVSGRVGRDGDGGNVIIQTYSPDNFAIRAAAANDYMQFYRSELSHRMTMNYPPFSDIITVSFVEKKEAIESDGSALTYAYDFRKKLIAVDARIKESEAFEPMEKITKGKRERVYAELIIKAPKGSRASVVKAFLKYRQDMILSKAGCYIEIDVNPY